MLMNQLSWLTIFDSRRIFAIFQKEVFTAQSLMACLVLAMVEGLGFDVRAAAKVYFKVFLDEF